MTWTDESVSRRCVHVISGNDCGMHCAYNIMRRLQHPEEEAPFKSDSFPDDSVDSKAYNDQFTQIRSNLQRAIVAAAASEEE